MAFPLVSWVRILVYLQANEELNQLDSVCCTLILLSDDMQPHQVGELFETFTLLWQEARICIDTIEFSKTIVWKDLVPEGFEDTATELMSKVGSTSARTQQGSSSHIQRLRVFHGSEPQHV